MREEVEEEKGKAAHASVEVKSCGFAPRLSLRAEPLQPGHNELSFTVSPALFLTYASRR